MLTCSGGVLFISHSVNWGHFLAFVLLTLLNVVKHKETSRGKLSRTRSAISHWGKLLIWI